MTKRKNKNTYNRAYRISAGVCVLCIFLPLIFYNYSFYIAPIAIVGLIQFAVVGVIMKKKLKDGEIKDLE
jgi:hypothetical protein